MKNKTKLAIVHFIGMVLSLLVVMAAHYVYDKFPNFYTSLFFPVNESIWEHNKLFVLPIMLVYLIIYFIIGRKFKNYIPATFLSLIYMPILSFLSFQVYLMIAGTHHKLSGIIVSAILLVLGFVVSYFMTIKEKLIGKEATVIIILCVVVFVILMAVLTYYPPKADWLKWLFMDSITKTYGVPR